jgi:phospholipid N-methyltransferase
MATVKQADLSALEIGKKFAERIHALFPDAKILLYGSAVKV